MASYKTIRTLGDCPPCQPRKAQEPRKPRHWFWGDWQAETPSGQLRAPRADKARVTARDVASLAGPDKPRKPRKTNE